MAQPRATPPADPTERLLGASPAIAALRAQIRHLAAFDAVGSPHVPTVLIAGETGTGKGLVARLLHDSGPRARGPFLEVNCAAIPDTMLEAELFGFEAGAFTDAKRAKPGLFEAAAQGTLFLDEIDALPVLLQSKLLKAIEEKRMRRLGAVGERPVDVKIIAATAADLPARAADGRFRLDLYHRLAVLLLELPPLRARGEDIVRLARHSLERYAAGYRLPPKRLSREAEAWLQHYAWPGNVRELGHLMERVVLLHPDALVTAEALGRLGLPGGPPAAKAAEPAPEGRPAADDPAEIRQALAQTGGNVVQAARRLGWSRKALLYRMRRHKIEAPPRSHGRPPRAPHQEKGFVAPPEAPPVSAAGAEQKPAVILAIELTFPEATGAAPAYEPWTAARRWAQVITEKVLGFGGTLVQRAPSLLLVAFGVPHTLEQLPQRAVQAALALRQLTAEERVPGPGLRQAMHWGPVMMDQQARKPAHGLLPLGDTLALPVRLLGQTGPGEIVLSPELARLVVGWCELEALPLPTGTDMPVRVSAYRVGVLVSRRAPKAGLGAQALSPFVGRARELAMLQATWAEVERGRGQAVGLVGEPGMGKSRLLLEFRQRLMGQRMTYLEGRCLAYGQHSPYLPVLELLRDNCGIAEADASELMAEKVRFALQEVGLAPDEWASYLLHLLGLPGALGQVPELSPQALRQRTVEVLWQLSLHGSQQRPLVLAIEDLQWIDPSSEAFIATLVERLAGAPILFFATYRPSYRPPWLERSYATQLTLPPLGPEDSRRVLQAVWQDASLPAPVTQTILARAEGNPLFLEELTRAVLEQGVAQATAAVPETLQGVLLARLDRLPAEAKRALQLASVVGRDCPLPLLEAVWAGTATPLPPALTRLVEAELLYQQGVPPQATYLFKHALIQEAAYQSVLKSRRQQVHQRIAQVLEAWSPEMVEIRPERLAHHYTEAGLSEQAIPYWQRAGQQALQRSANPEAIQHLTKGLALLATLPETPVRALQELDLQLALGPAQQATKGAGSPEVEQTYVRARTLCVQVGQTPQLLQAQRGLWRSYHTRGALPTAREHGEQLLRLAQRTAVPMHLLEAHDALGATLFQLGEYVTARTHHEQGVALTDLAAQRALAIRYDVAPGVSCLAFAALTLWCLGYPAQALRRSQEALTLAQELAHPPSLAQAVHLAAFLQHHLHEVPAVQAQADALLSLATTQGFPLFVGFARCWQGWALAMQGQGEAGVAQLREGQAAILAAGQTVARPFCLVLLAEAAEHVGAIEEGRHLLAEALAAFEASGRGDLLAEAYRLQGTFLLRQGTPDAAEAEACFQQALAIARRQQAKSWELRAAISLSRLWQQRGKCAEARALLAAIYGWFTEGFDTPDLQEVQTLLAELR